MLLRLRFLVMPAPVDDDEREGDGCGCAVDEEARRDGEAAALEAADACRALRRGDWAPLYMKSWSCSLPLKDVVCEESSWLWPTSSFKAAWVSSDVMMREAAGRSWRLKPCRIRWKRRAMRRELY